MAASSLGRTALRKVMSASNGTVARVNQTSVRYATSPFRMPAMSPTMTEGGIASWKKQEGESFIAGDVLLEIETDKATIDVEAQDDGVMGKIITKDGAKGVPVGQIIAVLAEEGDDLSAITIPEESAPASSSAPAPSSSSSSSTSEASASKASKGYGSSETPAKHAETSAKGHEVAGGEVGHGHGKIEHDKPLFPSVQRLLAGSNLSPEKIKALKGTGRGGMLTKGDVLFAMGKISSARGTAGKLPVTSAGGEPKGAATKPEDAKKPTAPLTAAEIRRLVVQGLEKASKPVPFSAAAGISAQDFDSVLEPYSSLFAKPAQPAVVIPSVDVLVGEMAAPKAAPVKDEWEGLF